MSVPTIARGRFAPTPSGELHVGSARTALASALSAWSRGGRWMLRVEDIDRARTLPGSTSRMLDDLRWLGLEWDEGPSVGGPHNPYEQSLRGELYRSALDVLRRAGTFYPCACSRRDIEQAGVAPHGADTVYPGTCRSLDPDEVRSRATLLGREPSWRFAVSPNTAVSFTDEIAGPVTQRVDEVVGDFVVWRSDGTAAYQLAVVVDDAVMEVTEVLRGDDLLSNTPRQLLLYRALEAEVPRWAHVPLVLGGSGERLAKRDRDLGLAGLRARGTDPRPLIDDLLASLGVEGSVRDRSLRDLASRFDLARVPREPLRWP